MKIQEETDVKEYQIRKKKSREQSRFVVMVKKRPKRWHLMILRRFWITILKHIAAMKIKKSFKQLTILNRTVKI